MYLIVFFILFLSLSSIVKHVWEVSSVIKRFIATNMPSFLGLFGANPDLDSLHPYETSWLLSPGLFAGLRALIGVYLWVTIILIYSWDSAHGETKTIRESFSYFTYLNLWGMAFYFLVAFVHTILYARTGRSVIFNRLPRFFRALHSFFYTCNTTLPILVLIVYWSILYSNPWFPEVFTAWQNVQLSPKFHYPSSIISLSRSIYIYIVK